MLKSLISNEICENIDRQLVCTTVAYFVPNAIFFAVLDWKFL